MDVIHRQGQKRPETPRRPFSIPETVFSADKVEQAKATLARKGSHYGQATGAVGHGAAVMPTLSAKAQKLLKATPFSQPIAPSTSGLSTAPRKKASS